VNVARYEPTVNATLDLTMGPTDAPGELTVEQLEVAWEVERDSLMDHCRRNPNPGWRSWGWWQFEAGEEMPRGRDAETLRLAELGELRDDELAALQERANEARLRVDTGGERISAFRTDFEQRPDRDAVALHARVEAALRAGRE
jgi:hypothetical protein